MDKIQEDFIKTSLQQKNKINLIADALKFSTSEPKIATKDLPDGSIQKVSEIFSSSGNSIYTVEKNDKNTMTFSSKKQLMDFLGD